MEKISLQNSNIINMMFENDLLLSAEKYYIFILFQFNYLSQFIPLQHRRDAIE